MARSFNGTSDEITYPNDTAIDILGNVTIYCWVWLDAANRFHTMVSKEGTDPSIRVPYEFRTDNDASMNLVLVRADETASTAMTSTGAIATGKWQHIAVTHDNSNANFYINGALDSTIAGVRTPTSLGNPLRLANRTAGLFLQGKLAFVGVHNVILTLGEIKNAMRRGFTYRGLKFATIVGHDADLSGFARAPTITGSALFKNPPVAPPFGLYSGWQGAFTAAAGGGGAIKHWMRYEHDMTGGMQQLGGV